ncbi:hypothetical protein CC80DRAFT_401419 [Byssothecium circinans]|uniref:Mid2 domain-containing protein n=1 Tax=Byssothecium circinans TaxID=147558 RepID=A0A6A5UB02_9PLEO|nr:hypothetical protein CC80DRAFT_401419 [Byssothecium circinans]
MVRLTTAAPVAWMLTGVSCLMEFINPAPFTEISKFKDNPVYVKGSTVNIAWTGGEENEGASLVLYQLNNTDGIWFGDMEYLTQSAVVVTRYTWLVGTRKNLSVSNLFYLSIFEEGKSLSDSNSQYFNITEAQSTSSSSLSPSNSPTTTTRPLASTPTSNASAGPYTSTFPTPQSSSIFPTGAKIGTGVGIPAALLVCLGAGFFLFRRHKQRRNIAAVAPPYPPNDYQYPDGSYYGSNSNDALPKSPVEMGQPENPYVAYHDSQAKQSVGGGAEPVRYEM